MSTSSIADIKPAFFTPTRQIAHCGHATIATFNFLAQQGQFGEGSFTKETIDRARKIVLRRNEAFMAQTAPEFQPLADLQPQLLESLGLRPKQIIAPPMRVDTGNGFVVIGVTDLSVLAAIQPQLRAIDVLSDQRDVIGFYVFSLDTVHPDRHASARMFASRYGIPEESATGMAAGPLAAYLAHQLPQPQTLFLIEQGHFMAPASPSIIQVQLERDAQTIHSLMTSGSATFIDYLTLEV